MTSAVSIKVAAAQALTERTADWLMHRLEREALPIPNGAARQVRWLLDAAAELGSARLRLRALDFAGDLLRVALDEPELAHVLAAPERVIELQRRAGVRVCQTALSRMIDGAEVKRLATVLPCRLAHLPSEAPGQVLPPPCVFDAVHVLDHIERSGAAVLYQALAQRSKPVADLLAATLRWDADMLAQAVAVPDTILAEILRQALEEMRDAK